MASRMARRAPFVVTVGLVAGASLVACGGSVGDGGGSSGSSGTGSGGSGTGGAGATGTGGAGVGGTGTGGTGVGGTGGTGVGGAYNTGGVGGNPPPPWQPCPDALPTNGETCWVDPAEWCSFSNGPCCPATQARCVGYVWEVLYTSCNPPPPEPCPAVPPDEGAPCGTADPCGATYQYCDYCASDATVAVCENGVWVRQFGPCGG